MFKITSLRALFCSSRRAIVMGVITCCALTAPNAGAQVAADLQLISSQIYYISDFDINGVGNATDFFNLTLTSDVPVPANTVRLRMRMTSNNQTLIEGTTRSLPFNLPQGQLIPPITYRDFRGFGGRGIQIDRFTYNSNSLGQITDAVLRTSRLPSGTYVVTVEVISTSGATIASDQAVLVISNPITLDLISPGQLAGGAECPVIFSNLPQFTWNSDASRFLLTVCEKLPNNSGPEDVMQNPPRFQRILNSGADFFGTPSFLYPSSALPLQPGRIYYWQITVITTSTSGEVRLPGEIWCFQMQNEMGGDRALMLQELLSLLASLGVDDIEDLFAAGGPLERNLPTGRVIINGQIVDLNELFAMLRGGAMKIKSFSVE